MLKSPPIISVKDFEKLRKQSNFNVKTAATLAAVAAATSYAGYLKKKELDKSEETEKQRTVSEEKVSSLTSQLQEEKQKKVYCEREKTENEQKFSREKEQYTQNLKVEHDRKYQEKEVQLQKRYDVVMKQCFQLSKECKPLKNRNNQLNALLTAKNAEIQKLNESHSHAIEQIKQVKALEMNKYINESNRLKRLLLTLVNRIEKDPTWSRIVPNSTDYMTGIELSPPSTILPLSEQNMKNLLQYLKTDIPLISVSSSSDLDEVDLH